MRRSDEMEQIRAQINRLETRVNKLNWEIRHPAEFLAGDRVIAKRHDGATEITFHGVIIDGGEVSDESYNNKPYFIRRYQVFSDTDKRLYNIPERAISGDE